MENERLVVDRKEGGGSVGEGFEFTERAAGENDGGVDCGSDVVAKDFFDDLRAISGSMAVDHGLDLVE